MSINAPHVAQDLVDLSCDPEKIIRGNTTGPSTPRVVAEAGDDRPRRREKCASIGTSSMAKVLAAAEAPRQVSEKTSLQIQSLKELGLDALATKGEAPEIARRTIDQALQRLDEPHVDLAVQNFIDALENCNSFICCSVRNALHDILLAIYSGRHWYERSIRHGCGSCHGGER